MNKNMKKAMKSSIQKALSKKIFKSIHKFALFLYSFSAVFSLFKRNKLAVRKSRIKQVNNMNKIMKYVYKRSELTIDFDNYAVSIEFLTQDNLKIKGFKYIINPQSKKWIITSHWFAGDKYWGLFNAKPFIELGYNILAFDYRNHGESDKTDVVSMGLFENYDLLAAIKFLNEIEEIETIGLHGMSMGAFIANYVAATQKDFLDSNNVKFIVSDSTYGSLESLLYKTVRVRFRLIFNHKFAKKLIDKTLELQKIATNTDQSELNLFDKYEKYDISPASCPTLFIHGANDSVTPHTDTLRLFIDRSKYNLGDEILIYNTAGHCFSIKEHYYQTVYRMIMFENKITNDNESSTKALKRMGITEEVIKNNFNEVREVPTFHSGHKKSNY
ncbi:alpha/beta hydrolase [Mycoplasmopsis bovis]|uniref:alpha/beta hydrolase n=1 Tax=Mycoplasmopsis bovis TaxID=28903 RepID=UPI001BDF4204|nr:alpha/beta fold hydrolase [Mycoplasmopsis bovis]